MNQNPYAPPQAELNLAKESYQSGRIWREGNLLCFRSGAALPNRCFVTGEITRISFPISQYWQPIWVYLLVIPGIIPYLIASPMLGRYIHLEIPISRGLHQKHLRRTRAGFTIMLASAAAFLGGFLTVIYGWLAPAFTAPLLLQAPLFMFVGIALASRPPMRLRVASFEGDLLKLRNIHPDCLAVVPERNPGSPDHSSVAGR